MLAKSRLPSFALAGLIVFSLPAYAADFEIDNFKLDFGKVVVTAPKLSVKGSALEREAFVSLFDGSNGASAVERIGRLEATEISAPELVVEQQMGPQKQVSTYRDIRFAEIRQGRIGSGETAGAAISVTGAESGPMKGEMLRMTFEGFDLRQTARVLTEKAQPGVEEKSLPLVERVTQDGYSLDLGKGGRLSMGKAHGRDFGAKVGSEPLGEVLGQFIARTEELEKKTDALVDKPTDEAREKAEAEERKLALSVVQLLENFDYGSGEVFDVKMSLPVPAEPRKGKDSPTKIIEGSIARIAYGQDTPAKSGYIVEGVSFGDVEVKGRIGSYSQSGFSYAAVLSELRTLLSSDDPDFENLDWRRFVPVLGTTRMEGFEVEASPKKGPRAGEPFRTSIGLFELAVGEQLNGLPTAVGLTIDKLVFPVVPSPGNAAGRELLAMGFKTIDLSTKIDLAWDQGRNEIALRNFSLSGADMGSFSATGTIANVTKEVFSSDLALAQVAALGATVRVLDATLKNAGLAEKLIENQARKTKKKVEEVRQEYAMIANLGLSALLGPSEGAKTLASALSRFVARPGTLSVSASAKAPGGIGLADFLTMAEPADIFEKIELKADAQ